ncbi:Antirestriction protein (ArdA) [compost metagenome]
MDVELAVLAAGLACGLEPNAIEDAYMGEWNSDEDMAFDLWEQGGMLESIPESARGYINWELVARDMLMSGVTEANGHYFHAA